VDAETAVKKLLEALAASKEGGGEGKLEQSKQRGGSNQQERERGNGPVVSMDANFSRPEILNRMKETARRIQEGKLRGMATVKGKKRILARSMDSSPLPPMVVINARKVEEK